MSSVESVSILLPVLDGARYLGRVLAALAEQEVELAWDFLALDCGSTDGTLEILAERRKGFPVALRVHGIRREEFNHGCARNLLAALSGGELLVYITDDAIPMAADWLATLARNFDDPDVAAAYCRNVTRPGADVLVRAFNEVDPAYGTRRVETRLPPAAEYARMSPLERRVFFNFCDTASAMRRSAWRRHPYPRCVFGEDVMMARAFVEAGYKVVFDERACVEHSHDYGPDDLARRARADAQFNAEWMGRVCVPTRKTALRLAREQVREDREALAASGVAGEALKAELARASEARRAHFLGLWEGGRSRRRRPPSGMLAEREFCVTLLADEAWRDYSRALAEELARLGYAATVVEWGAGASSADVLAARPELVHFCFSSSAVRPALLHVFRARIPYLVQLGPELAARQGGELAGGDVVEACKRAALALAATREMRAVLLAEASFDPMQLAFSPCAEPAPAAGDGRERTLHENALELDFRYRTILAQVGAAPPGVLLERNGDDATACAGPVEAEGFGVLRLGPARPGSAAGASAEYRFGAFDRKALVDVHATFGGARAGERCAARVRLDGRAFGAFGPFESAGAREDLVFTLEVEPARDVRRLRIANHPATAPLRLTRVVVREAERRAPRPTDIARQTVVAAAGWLDVFPSLAP